MLGRLPVAVRAMGRGPCAPSSELTESEMDAADSSCGAAGWGMITCGKGSATRVYPSTMGCCSSCRALGRALASRSIMDPTKPAHAGESVAENGRIRPAVMAAFISALSRPSKGRWPVMAGFLLGGVRQTPMKLGVGSFVRLHN